MKRRILSTAPVAAIAVMAAAAPALAAAWSVAGAGLGSASATVLAAPTVTSSSSTATAATISVTAAPAAGPTPSSYRVDRTAPVAAASVCTISGATGSCSDTSPTPGVSNAYAVFSRVGSAWVAATAATTSVTVPAAGSPNFLLTPAAGTYTAGVAFNVTVQARIGTVNDVSYTGGKTLVLTGSNSPNATAPTMTSSPATFTAGAATVSVTLFKSGPNTFTIADASPATRDGSATLTVAANPALGFSTCHATWTKNTSFATTVTRSAADPYGNVAATPAITVTLAPYDAGGSNHNFTVQTVSLGAGVLASATVTYETANGNGVSTFTASATGYTTVSCTVTTS